MGTINLGNSLRYDMTGRKRKTKSLKTKKVSYFVIHLSKYLNMFWTDRKPAEDHRKKYPSMTTSKYSSQKDNELEESKKFTVAPYNKGAYQVIPKKDIKWIGK